MATADPYKLPVLPIGYTDFDIVTHVGHEFWLVRQFGTLRLAGSTNAQCSATTWKFEPCDAVAQLICNSIASPYWDIYTAVNGGCSCLHPCLLIDDADQEHELGELQG